LRENEVFVEAVKSKFRKKSFSLYNIVMLENIAEFFQKMKWFKVSFDAKLFLQKKSFTSNNFFWHNLWKTHMFTIKYMIMFTYIC